VTDAADVLRRWSWSALEMGLLGMSAALRTTQDGIGALTGGVSPRLTGPPVERAPDLDRGTSELVNRVSRVAMYAPVDGGGRAAIVSAAMESARNLLAAVSTNPRRVATLPIQLPLSFATLGLQEALRLVYGLQILGGSAPSFIAEIAEVFLDGPVYLQLEYMTQLRRLQAHVRAAPEDGAAWHELGRYCMKCGMYHDAAAALTVAAGFPALRASSLSQRAVANYRAARYADAVRDAVDSLTLEPHQPRAHYWLWLAAGHLGGYPPTVPPALRVEMAAGRGETALRYDSVASEVGLDKTGEGRGIAVFDYDGDGHLDVLVAASGGCSLFHNNGDGTFTDRSVGSGIDTCVSSFAVTVGDYDGDGKPDVFITRQGFLEGASVLYRNNGDGTFTDVTAAAGLSGWMSTFCANWADYDCDGHLDLFVGSNLNGLFGRKVPDRLFRNNGDGTFTDVTAAAGILTPWSTIGAAWGDFDNDGYPDLFLSSAFGRSQLFHNNGDGTFTNVSAEAGIDAPCFGSVAFWCDYDDDGWLDLVQYVWCEHEDMLQSLREGAGPADRALRIFHNNRNGTFTNVSADLGVTECWGSMSGNAADLDNDGYVDLVLGNGGPQVATCGPPLVLQFDGRRFRNVTFTAGLPRFGKSHGATIADLAGDGRLHILLASGGFYPAEPMPLEVYRPRARLGNYLNLRLTGVRSNRDAIGARVRLVAGGRTQHRLVSGGSGFGSLPLEQHFGVGAATSLEAVEIDWPSRARQRIVNPPVNATIGVVEGVEGFTVIRRADDHLG